MYFLVWLIWLMTFHPFLKTFVHGGASVDRTMRPTKAKKVLQAVSRQAGERCDTYRIAKDFKVPLKGRLFELQSQLSAVHHYIIKPWASWLRVRLGSGEGLIGNNWEPTNRRHTCHLVELYSIADIIIKRKKVYIFVVLHKICMTKFLVTVASFEFMQFQRDIEIWVNKACHRRT